ncbi:DUF6314 family protein [Variovorax ureilyticus]|uniref:DUF6314 family protein n=1 Tax=Variovorax ureilyticus TaxID=1836198 RepID=A0ABU8VFS0_9BURK
MTTGPWHGAHVVFDQLEGAWDLDRNIENQATMTGTAVFERRQPDVMAYREEGRVRLAGGKELDAFREYRFERAPRGFTVFFNEAPPRVFHHIELERDGDAFAGLATHLCSPDVYDSSYRFLADGTFVVCHTVRGPRKDYVSATLFKRRKAR